MAEITWRTLTGGMSADPSRSLEAAQRSFNAALQPFGDLLAQRERTQAGNVQVGQDAARNEFMDALQGARTMEELSALQSSGRLDQLKAGMNPTTAASVRSALDDRTKGLRDSITQAQTFERAQQTEKERPIRDSIQSMAIAGNFSGARELIRQNGNMLNRTELEKFLQDAERGDTKWDQQKKEWKWAAEDQGMEEARHKDTLLTNAQQRRASAASAAASAASADWNRYQHNREKNNDKQGDQAKNILGEEIAAARKENESYRATQEAIAKKHGITVDQIQKGDLAGLGVAKASQLHEELRSAGVLDPISQTTRLDRLQKRFDQAGIDVDMQGRALQAGSSFLRTDTPLTGDDATKLKGKEDAVTNYYNGLRDKNLSWQDPAKRVEEERKAYEWVDKNLKDNDWTKQGVKEGLGAIMENGVNVGTRDKPVIVYPSGRRLAAALERTAEKDEWWIGLNETDSNVRDELKRFYKTKEGKEEYEKAQALNGGAEEAQKGDERRKFLASIGRSSTDLNAPFENYFTKLRNSKKAN